MKDTEIRSLNMFKHVLVFGETHDTDFKAGSKGRELLDALKELVGQLETHAANQTSGGATAKQGTGNKEEARRTLQALVKAMSQTARAIAIETPGFDQRFRMPRGNNDQTLLNTARAFATDAVPFKAEFIRYELPSTFLKDLDAAISNFEQAISSQNQGKATRVSSTASLAATIERGVALVRQLEAIVQNKYRNDQSALRAWDSASRIEHAPQSKAARKKPGPPPPSQTTKAD